jgi:potassium/hydrogen antiporter
VLLTIGVIETWRDGSSPASWIVFGALQLGGGLAIGGAIGGATRWALRRVQLESSTTYAVLALAIGGFSYGLAAALGASGFLAIYVTGVVLARKQRLVRPLRSFHAALAAAAEAALFLILGLLVFPSDLPDVFDEAAVIVVALVLVARPLAVVVCLVWFRMRPAELALVSWAGLRGAVPIVLATVPLTAGHPDGQLIFNVVFVVVVIAVAVQAPTIELLGRRLGLATVASGEGEVELIPLDSMSADVLQLTLSSMSRVVGRRLADVPMPRRSRIAFARRDDATFVPDGETVLCAGDVLSIVVPPDTTAPDIAAWGGDASDRIDS